MKVGLTRRKSGKYSLTILGKVVYEAQLGIQHAVDIYPKLKAVDTLQMSHRLPKDERKKVIDTLLGNVVKT